MLNLPQIQRGELFHWGELKLFHSLGHDDFFNAHTHWFAYARQALKFGLKVLKIHPLDKVLVPAYICNVIESPLSSLGIRISYYNIKRDLNPDFEDLERKIDKSTKALLCVNYFGFAAPFDSIQEFCREHDLFFIENNAHGFLSKKNGQRLGTFGDISITSVWKSIPVMHGALLRINPKLGLNVYSPSQKRYRIKENSLRFMIRYMRTFILNIKAFPFSVLRKRQLSKKIAYWNNSVNRTTDRLMEVKLHFLIPIITRCLCLETLNKNRMNKYKKIVIFLNEQSLFRGKPLFKNLPDGIVPSQVPFLLKDEEINRRELLTFLNRNGVEAFYWPDLPEDVFKNPDNYPIANYLRDHCIHFPV